MREITTAIAIVGVTLGTFACVAISAIAYRQIQAKLDISRGVDKEFSLYDKDDT